MADRSKKLLKQCVPFIRGHRATLLESLGVCVFLTGCWFVYRPLPFLVAGAGLLGLGFLIDYTERKP